MGTQKMRKNNGFLALIVSLLISSSLCAGENSTASISDIKEALYKIIIKLKKSDGIENKNDKLDLYIEKYVVDNKLAIENIK